MRTSRLLAPTLREDPQEAEVASHRLMLRAGMIKKLAAGVYSFLPLGLRVIHKVSNIIREEMNLSGAEEVLLPALLPAELWKETGRWDIYGKELFRIDDRHDRSFCLGPTHEEVITDLVRSFVKSYRQLPINLYQIQTKFRDEVRPRFGIMRGREFLMKDSYSFHDTEESLEKEYQNMRQTYCRIFDRIGLKYGIVQADNGTMGGGFSEEFMVLADTGEEELLSCPSCKFAASREVVKEGNTCPKCQSEFTVTRGIEVGHIFKLGTKYSNSMKATFLDKDNQDKPFIMGCYGIGVGRTAAAAIEQNNDKDGIIWPSAIAPYKIVIVPANIEDQDQSKAAEDLYNQFNALPNFKGEVLLDDRDDRMGVKLKDADLIGYPVKIILGRSLKEGKVEVKIRKTGETKLIELNKVVEEINV